MSERTYGGVATETLRTLPAWRQHGVVQDLLDRVEELEGALDRAHQQAVIDSEVLAEWRKLRHEFLDEWGHPGTTCVTCNQPKDSIIHETDD